MRRQSMSLALALLLLLLPALAAAQVTPAVAGADAAKALIGPVPYLWILLRFADDAGTPQPASYFVGQALGGYPSLDHYFREISYGQANLQGSEVQGWFNLPQPRSYYVYDMDPEDPGDEFDATRALNDAVALVNAFVDFSDFDGMQLCFNGELDGYSYGGRRTMSLDGTTDTWGVTWLAPSGWSNLDIVAFETGLSLGWLPSSGPQYSDSHWDVMGTPPCGECTVADPTYGNLAVHPIAFHKLQAGWIAPALAYGAGPYPWVTTIRLHAAEVAPTGGSYAMVFLEAVQGYVNSYLTVERRNIWGYDQNLPDATVVMHWINYDDYDAHPIANDGDYGTDPNDEGGRWDVGETNFSLINGFVVTVLDADADGSVVSVTNHGREAIYVDAAFVGEQYGTQTNPLRSFHDGYSCTFPYTENTVNIAPGTYTAPYTLYKPSTLRRWGESGMVTIGR